MPSLEELEAVCAIASSGFNISAAAKALGRHQPTVSRQVQKIERELGACIFARTHNRVAALTPVGQEILRICERMLRDAESLSRVATGEASDGLGELKIATTHLHARYSLPNVLKDFSVRFANVGLTLRQADSLRCCQLVAAGEADIGVATLHEKNVDEVAAIPAYKVPRCVVAPRDHPLAREKKLTLRKLVGYPVVAYSTAFSGRWIVDEAFARAGLKPHIVCSAIDADVIKKCVETGMGVAILARIAFDPIRDRGLVAIDADHLFRPITASVVLRRFGYLSRPSREFISLFAPHISQELIQSAIDGAVVDHARLVQGAPTAATN